MKILLGCDVDPVLPAILGHRPGGDVWRCLDLVEDLVATWGAGLPPITWLIRADDSVRFASGEFCSGFTSRAPLWRKLQDDGHEIGWHLHLMSMNPGHGCYGFDADPPWLADAFRALSVHVDIRATRIGWDYGSNALFGNLDRLGVAVDFSALPGNIVWAPAGRDTVCVDWRRCPGAPYHPSAEDYQRPGSLNLLEIPISQFRNSAAGMAKRLMWRIRNGCWTVAGLGQKTRLMTEAWDAMPPGDGPLWAFFFHPEDLAGEGGVHFRRNIEALRREPQAEFMTASAAARWVEGARLGQGQA